MPQPNEIKHGDVVEAWNLSRHDSCFGFYKGKNQWGGHMISKYRDSKAREAFNHIKRVNLEKDA